MIFSSFFDESGMDHLQSKTLVMGGFLGHFDECRRAADAWDGCLRDSPSIQYFSHSEANTLSGEFRFFSRTEADEKSKNLAKVIARFLLQGFCVSVPHAVFASRDSQAARGMMGSRVYDWGFLAATSGVLQYMSRLDAEYTVDFIFDKRKELRACIDTYEEMKSLGVQYMTHAGSCKPGDDKVQAPLQMADLLAGEYSYLSEKSVPPREAFAIIAAARPVIHLPCQPPPLIPETLSIQKRGSEIRRQSFALLKRIYKDKEKSVQLAKDVIDLKLQEESFWKEFRRIRDLYGPGLEQFNQGLNEDGDETGD